MKNSLSLIFFLMIGSSLSMAEEIVNLAITPTEYILGNTHLASLDELAVELSNLSPKELRINPEKGISYDRVSNALKVIQKQGNISIGIVGNAKSE